MAEIISKEKADELMRIKGELRGAVFKTDVNFIIREKGEEGLRKVEDEMKNLGYVFKYEDIKTMEFYPLGLRAVSLLVIKKALGFSDEKIKEMGFYVAKSSFVLRLSLKFLGLAKKPELYYRSTPNLWKKFVTIGEYSIPEFDEEKKKIVVNRIKDLNSHPIFCTYLSGIIPGFLETARGISEVQVEETKCPFKGDEYHEFVLKW